MLLSTCIFRCHPGLYGPSCREQCSPNCITFKGFDDICDFYGNCNFGCDDTYFGDKCDTQKCPFEHCLSCGYNLYSSLECTKCEPGMAEFVLDVYNCCIKDSLSRCLHSDKSIFNTYYFCFVACMIMSWSYNSLDT